MQESSMETFLYPFVTSLFLRAVSFEQSGTQNISFFLLIFFEEECFYMFTLFSQTYPSGKNHFFILLKFSQYFSRWYFLTCVQWSTMDPKLGVIVDRGTLMVSKLKTGPQNGGCLRQVVIISGLTVFLHRRALNLV